VHYFLMFWNQVDDRIKIRQRQSVPPILNPKENPQDVPTP
jgi:hypothetical protein